jgi:DNA (cytosine-5)-methyltransferase 1
VNYEIYKKLEQGDDGTNSKISDIMPYAHRNHVFKDKYFKLIADKPSRTITAHLKMDCHSHIHPTQIRSITPREAARIFRRISKNIYANWECSTSCNG